MQQTRTLTMCFLLQKLGDGRRPLQLLNHIGLAVPTLVSVQFLLRLPFLLNSHLLDKHVLSGYDNTIVNI